MQCLATSDNPKYKEKGDNWHRKVRHYSEVTETAYNTEMLGNISEQNHAEPTSPAVQGSPAPGDVTPRLEENVIEVVEEIP